MNGVVEFILKRASERSTWIGLATLLGAAGVGIFASPEAQGYLATLGMALAGLVGIIVKESQD